MNHILYFCCLVAKSYLTLPVYSVHKISQARILEWVFPSAGDLPDPGIKPRSPELTGRYVTTEPTGKPICHIYLVLKKNSITSNSIPVNIKIYMHAHI